METDPVGSSSNCRPLISDISSDIIDGKIMVAIPLLAIILIGPVSSEFCNNTASDKFSASLKILSAYSNTVFPKAVRINPKAPLLNKIEDNSYDAIIIAVAHKEFKKMGIKKIRAFGKSKHVVYDLKYLFSATQVDKRL